MNQGLRLALAFGLSMAIMFLYSTFIAPPMPPTAVTDIELQQKTQTDTNGTATSLIAPSPDNKTSEPQALAADQSETKAEEKLITVETPSTKIVLSSKGAVLKDYFLKNYTKEVSKKSDITNLIDDTDGSSALFLGLKGYNKFDKSRVFEVTKDVVNRDNQRLIEMTWQNSEIRIIKTFSFQSLPTDYAVKVDYEISNVSGEPLEFTPYLENQVLQKPNPKKEGGFLSFLKTQQPDMFARLTFKEKSLTTSAKWDDTVAPETTAGLIDWSALSDRYFIFAVAHQPSLSTPVTAYFEKRGESIVNQFQSTPMILKAGSVVANSMTAYIGPKELSQLKSLNLNFEKSIDYGWFSVLAIPILWLMTFLHGFIPNWGLVIIALTFLVKMALHPVNKKSMQSMKAMQQLQPKLQEIKKKFENDRDKQNQEIMKLFRTHKVNPMGGCLPMLLQMPIYIVLYKVLWNAIELYHAPFFGFYQDLSAPDPFFILPALLGVFMFLQQKLTPAATTDPAQQKMMMFMPIMFTGFMLFLPVGLVVYIFVNTVMSVVQQFMIKRDLSFKQLMTGKWQPNGV